MHIVIAVIIVAIILAFLLIYHDMHSFVVVSYDIDTDKIEGEKTFCLLSDLHDHVYGNNNDTLLKRIDEINPDGILIAGDMITAHHSGDAQSIRPAVDLLNALKQKYPLYVGNGNHEFKVREYKDVYGNCYEEYTGKLHQNGIDIIINEHEDFDGTNIRIYGLELDYSFFPKLRKGKMYDGFMDDKLGKIDNNFFNILIAHNPIYFDEYADWGADLTVSGHIHGGIVRLPFIGGVISPAYNLFPKYDGGRFDQKGKTMILSRGLGTHTIPVRFYNPGELDVIRIHGTKRH